MGRGREQQAKCLEQCRRGRDRRDEGTEVRESWTVCGLEAKAAWSRVPESLSHSTAVMQGGKEGEKRDRVNFQSDSGAERVWGSSSGGSLCPGQADGWAEQG